MRFVAYAGTSTVLATGVIVRALHQRTNFYSACVYIAQSSACIMILTNLILLAVCVLMVGLQKLLYGPLRVIEIEQLYEKAWFAITETCLAMTIFREEVGFWFFVMFVSLLIGKVWGWIGEGRVEILEQQPPANPRLFHVRLSLSLLLSTVFAFYMLNHSVQTVREQAEPNMMVMFAFEFAVLTVTSLSTALRYTISLREMAIIREQTKMLLQERRARILRNREEVRQNAAGPGDAHTSDTGSSSDEINLDLEEDDVDVPGWEDKGRWIFYLDLATDFFKLVLYLSFFCVLFTFYGMPIHILRDVAITIRSFYKRINDFVRYRQATRDMNERYPDALAEEIAREDVCIICRETMRPWPVPNEVRFNVNGDAQRNMDARLRPKKLPCGHILHFACLRSWLERQQNCPTCRRPVLSPPSAVARTPIQQLFNQPAGPRAVVDQAIHGIEPPENRIPGLGQNRVRFFNIGPFRLGFGAGQDLRGLAHQFNRAQQHGGNQRPSPVGTNATGGVGATARFTPDAIQTQLQHIEQYFMQQINGLRLQAQQLYHVRALQGELARLRIAHAQEADGNEGHLGRSLNRSNDMHTIQLPLPSSAQLAFTPPQLSRPAANLQGLPPGLSLPEGWTLLPLQRLPQGIGDTASLPDTLQASAIGATNTINVVQNPNTHVGEASSSQSINSSAERQSSAALNQSLLSDNHPFPSRSATDTSISMPLEGRSVVNETPKSVETSNNPILQQGSPSSRGLPTTSYPHESIASSQEVSSTADIRKRTSATEGSKDKGKARAVTIEDAPDDSS